MQSLRVSSLEMLMLSSRVFIRAVLVLCLLSSSAVATFAQRSDFGTITIQVRPPDAFVFVDGERWVTPDPLQPLVIQLPPGVHRVEMRAPGRRTYATEVTVRAGENVPLNVALPPGDRTEPPPDRVEPPPPRYQPPPPPPSPPGPIVQTATTQDGPVFATDVKFTEIFGETSTLIGAYGGWVFGGQLLVGAGGYWQANETFGTHLTYGGPVVQWRLFPTSAVGLNLHALVGGGYVYADYCCGYGYPTPVAKGGKGGYYGYPYYWDNDVFFVAEPEAQIVFRFGPLVRLQAGAGYRATSANGLSGASGSISVSFGR
jgi:hypothetical protein